MFARRGLRLRIALLSLTALAPSALGSIAFASAEDDLHEQIKSGAARLLEAGDLAEYDRQASSLRDSHELTPGGIWKLYLFYKGADHIAPNGPHAPAWAPIESATDSYLRSHPDSPSALIARVRVLMAHAEELRFGGGGPADIDAAGSYVERARELLEQYREVGTRDPDWYVNRITVSTLQGSNKSKVMALAQEALDREPTYQPLLYVASNALLPKWGGNRELHQEFVALALAKSHDQLGTQAYGRIMFNIVRLDSEPIQALAAVGMDWPQLRYSLAEITAAYPDPWNANAERAMACLVGTEQDLNSATARTPTPLFSVAWYDRYTNWSDCASRQTSAREPESARALDSLLDGSFSAAFFITVTAAVLLCLVILLTVRNRIAAREGPGVPSAAAPDTVLSPSASWRIGQTFIGLILVLIGLAGVWGFGLLVEFRDTLPALALTFVCTMIACGGGMLIVNAVWFRIALRADALEVRQLLGVRSFRRADIASRRSVIVQGGKFLELRFKDKKRRPYKVAWVSSVNGSLETFLQDIPDSDAEAAKALEEEVRADSRLGKTPEERSARFARMTQYVRKAAYCIPALFVWATWYPHPYWLLIAVLALLPWVCLIAMKVFPGVLQLGTGTSNSPLRPDVTALLVGPVLLLALRSFQDIHTLDWQAELRWAVVVAAVYGLVLYRVSAGQPRKWSITLVMAAVCLAYGYGSTVGADALLDRSAGQTYRTHVLGKHVSGGRSRTYSLTVDPWGDAATPDRVTVPPGLWSQLNVGDEVCIDRHPGALAVPWYRVRPCAGN